MPPESTITAESIQNSADSLLYSGGTLDLQVAGEAVNLGGRVESQGDMRITAQTLRNENDLFSAKRVVGTLEENPEQIRIDQAGHPEQGQTFAKSEFSNLGSGYGASHQGEAADVKIHDLTFIRTKSQTSHKEVTESRPGVITSGGMLTITGAVKNVDSQLVAGDTLHIQGTLENQAQKEQERTVTFGTTQGSYTYKRGWPHKSRRRGYKDKVFMTPQVEQGAPAPLGISQVAENKGKAPEMQEIGKEKRQDAASFLDPFGASLTRTEQGRTKWQNLLQGSLYLVHPESTARYLMETDPKFTSRKQFLSSDYFFQKLQWDPDKVPKRLGDGFYEGMLVRQQILDRTGNRYLEGYSDEESEFRALMDAGVLYAQKTGLQPGVVLSEEQMAQLTSDMVWLENRTITYEGKPYEVLIPRVYLRPNRELELKADGSLVSGKKLWVETKAAIANEGTLQGKEVILEAGSLKNLGILQGDSLFAHTRGNLESTGEIRGNAQVKLLADDELHIRSTENRLAHQDVVDQVAGIAVTGKAGVLLLQSGKDLTVSGAVLQNLGEQGKTILKAGSSLQLGTLQLSSDKDMTLDSKNYLRTQRRTEMGTTMEAAGDVRLEAGDDMTLKAAQISSTQGEVELQAGGNLTLEAGKAYAGDQYALSHRERSLVSRSSTETRSDEQHEVILGSALSGKSLMAKAGNDFTLRGTSMAADGDIRLQAGGDLSLDTVDQKDISGVYQKTKRKGLMGAGMGILIGSEKKSGQVQQETHTQVGSMVGSLGGNVNLEAGNRLQTRGSSILAGKNITLSGKEIQVENAEDTYHYQEKQEYRRTGLTASLGGDYMDAAGTVSTLAQRAGTVRDGRLAALYGTEAALSTAKGLGDIQKSWDTAQKAAQEYRYANIFGKGKQASEAFDKMKAAKEKLPFVGKTAVTLNLGMGTQHSSHAVEINGTRVSGSQVLAGGNVTLKAGGKDILLKGSQVSGQNVELSAGENILLQAGKNQETIQEKDSAKGGNVGISMGRTGLVGISAEGGMVKGTSQEEKRYYTNAAVQADRKLTFTTGKDIHIAGGTLSGESVNGQVSGNLQLDSLQDTHTYQEKRKSAGFSADYGLGAGTLSGMGSLSRENTESRYRSVKEQTGIYAGQNGFALEVGKETGLKGAVISSQAETAKNTLSTGTLRYEDLRNEAAYSINSEGMQSGISGIRGKNGTTYYGGIAPIQDTPVKGRKSSETLSGIAQGNMTIRNSEEQKQELDKLNRNTQQALQKLGEIFDKQKIRERKELAGAFGALAFRTIGDIGLKNGWKEGGIEKTTLHAMIGGIMGKLTGNQFIVGGGAAAVNELMQKEMAKWTGTNPQLQQWASMVIGGTAAKLVGGDWRMGTASAGSGTRYNFLPHEDQQYLLRDIEKYENGELTQEEFVQKLKYYCAKDLYYNDGLNTDYISTELKEGGNPIISSQIINYSSLEDFFNAQGINTDQGLSYALAQYAKGFGVEYNYDNPELWNIINTKIGPQTGWMNKLNEYSIDLLSSTFYNKTIIDTTSLNEAEKWFDLRNALNINLAISSIDQSIELNNGFYGKIPAGLAGKASFVISIVEESKNYEGKKLGIAVISDTAGSALGDVLGVNLIKTINWNAGLNYNKPVLMIFIGKTLAQSMGASLGDYISYYLKKNIFNLEE
ncbi:MAG: hemagglutinin repeat-containing protein [Acidaminococcus sp.]|uniref:hemagglutinin repeat-containing protein n=1 Tax=Acidaminococcus sp. TaxID=1872103 RepID=UPI003F135FAB